MSNAGKVESGDIIAQPCHAHVNFNRSGLQYDTKCRCSISWRAVHWNPGVRESVLATVLYKSPASHIFAAHLTIAEDSASD